MVLRFEGVHTMADADELAKTMRRPGSAAVRLVLALLDDQLRERIVDDSQQLPRLKERAKLGRRLATHVLLSKSMPAGYIPRPTRRAVVVPLSINDTVFATGVHLGRETVGSYAGVRLAILMTDAVVYLRDHILNGSSSSLTSGSWITKRRVFFLTSSTVSSRMSGSTPSCGRQRCYCTSKS
jgi:hypothetical protein